MAHDSHEPPADMDYIGAIQTPAASPRPVDAAGNTGTSGTGAPTSSVPLLGSPVSSASPPVGLGRECAHLEKVVKDAIDGRCAVAGIHGLPGTGKSHLVEMLVAQAVGFTVVRLPVDPHDDGSDPMWSKAFERADALEPGDGKVGGGAGDAKGDQLHRSVANAIRATGRRTGAPVLLILENCTATQQPLAELIAGAVLDPDLGATAVFIVTWRDDPDGSSLSFRTSFPTHRLRPLTVDQSAEYLARRIGAAPEPSVLAELWRATGGNPAAMLSACSYLSDEQLHGLVPFPDPVPIGPDLVAAYGQWVEGLDADAAAATTIAATALMSRPVLQDALAQMDLAFEALDQVIEMKAISILGDRVEFVHPLTRAAAFQQATSRLKVSARRSVAQAYVWVDTSSGRPSRRHSRRPSATTTSPPCASGPPNTPSNAAMRTLPRGTRCSEPASPRIQSMRRAT